MPKLYSCDLCHKTFNHKKSFIKHQNKKVSCGIVTKTKGNETATKTKGNETATKIEGNETATKIKGNQVDDKNILINAFKYCLDVLRDNEGLTGEKALRNLSYLLILKLIEPRLENEIRIDEYQYDFGHINDESVDYHKRRLLGIVRFSNLAKEKEENIPVNIKYLWDDILAIHPSTKGVFLRGKGFDIQRQSTYKKLIDRLNSLDLSHVEYDVLGNAYEEVIQDIMTGKVLGQFFTQPLVKKMMVKLINPQIHPDGKIDTCGDPTMGTGGFLITYLKYVLQQANARNIQPDWEFIKNEGLYGKELEPDTYQLAVSNMLISSGHMFEKLDRGDSIRDPILRKFDNILANPPFGIKGLKYDDFQHSLKYQYIPIKTDNAVSLFIQAIIYMLKINGKCAVVLPDGQDLFSKTNKKLINVRKYLMKTCDLKEIIYLPSGIFTYTSIKTCVFHFVKKKEGTSVLETKIKTSKTHKEIGRNYKFSGKHQTTKVRFYDYDPYQEIKTLLVKVPIQKIADNAYSLHYNDYMETGQEYGEGIVVKTLGEICEIIKGKKRNSKEGKEIGLYPLYYCSILGNLYLDTYDYTGEGIIINKTNGSGKAMVYYGENKYNVGQTTLHFKSKTNSVNTKYIYYYLLYHIPIIEQYFKGANQKSIVAADLFNIKIPIPSIERQREIVEYCEYNDLVNKQLEKEIENNKKQAEEFIIRVIKTHDS